MKIEVALTDCEAAYGVQHSGVRRITLAPPHSFIRLGSPLPLSTRIACNSTPHGLRLSLDLVLSCGSAESAGERVLPPLLLPPASLALSSYPVHPPYLLYPAMTDTLTAQLESASSASAPLLSPSVLPSSSSSSSTASVGLSSFPRPYRFDSSPTLTLSLTSSYAMHWTARDGVRELVQNWYDGCNANLRSVNQRTAHSTYYTLTIAHSSSPHHTLHTATASHSSRPTLHLGYVMHHSPSNTLTFHNNAVSLSRAILLLGHTSKRTAGGGGGSGGAGTGTGGGGTSVEGMVGSFGEGMKVGMLALLRDGCRCWMGTRGEVWQFQFYDDEKYCETLLGVWTSAVSEGQQQECSTTEEQRRETEKADEAKWAGLSAEQRQERIVLRALLDARKPTDTTTVLAGISGKDWSAFQHDFLFLSPTAPSSVVTTSLGSILLSDAHRHCLYVKGFLVASFPNDLVYGVDLRDAKLDRDRKAVLATSELHRVVGSIWAQAVSAQPDGARLMDRYFELLLHHSSSAESKHAEYYLTASVIENVASTFFALHGHDSQPVLNSSGDDAVFISTQLSRRPVLVPAALYDILTRSQRIQPVEQLISQHQQSRNVSQTALSSLPPQQLHCLQSAVRLLQTLSPLFTIEVVAVTSFADEESQWCKEEEAGGAVVGGARAGKVLLDSRCLDIQKVHERWGDCGLEDRRVQQGRGRGVKGLVAMTECSCREVVIAALILKETRRVRWKNGAVAADAVSADSGSRPAGNRRGGDAIMEHIARGRESELLIINMLERTVRRAETERMRRQALEEEKQLVLQHLQHSTDKKQQQYDEQKTGTANHDHKEPEPAHSEQDGDSGGVVVESEMDDGHERRDLRVLHLQHAVEVLRADLHREQQLAAQHAVDAQTRERLLQGAVAELSGHMLDGLSDERLRELERLHVTALTELHRIREERRRQVAEAEEERRKRSECGVCMSRSIDCVLLPCRHANVCYECARRMDKCGVCRQWVDDRIQYFS